MNLTGNEDFPKLLHMLTRTHNQHVNGIMTVAALAFDQGAVEVKKNATVPLLTFALQGFSSLPKGTFMVPRAWDTLWGVEPFASASVVVRAASLLVDYFNNRFIGQTTAAYDRAAAYEAEYLTSYARKIESFDSRQQAILKSFPEGVRTASIRHLIYRPSPYIPLADLV